MVMLRIQQVGIDLLLLRNCYILRDKIIQTPRVYINLASFYAFCEMFIDLYLCFFILFLIK